MIIMLLIILHHCNKIITVYHFKIRYQMDWGDAQNE